MARHAIIDKEGNVVSIIIWEGAEWLPPRNHTVVRSDVGNIGDTYDFDTKKFTSPIIKDEQVVDEKAALVSDEK